MSRVSKIVRRSLQGVLLAVSVLCLALHFTSPTRERIGLTAAALFAALFAAAVAGEAYSRWWQSQHEALPPEELARVRNRTALVTLCAVMFVVVAAMVLSARRLPLELLPLLAGAAALLQFALSFGKK